MSDENGQILEELKEIRKVLFLLLCNTMQLKDPTRSLKTAMEDAAGFLRGMEDPY